MTSKQTQEKHYMPLNNNGPREADEYMQELAAFAPSVDAYSEAQIDESNAGDVRDLIGKIDKVAKAAEKDRKALKEPYLEQGRKIDGSFKPVASLAEGLLGPLKKALNAFLQEQDRIKREAAEKARKEAEAAARAAEALKQDEFVGDYAAEQAAEKAKAARLAEEMAKVTNVQGNESDRALGLRTYRRAQITNAAMLVGHYAAHPDVVALCEKLANAEIRAAKGGAVNIPGIEVIEEKKVA